jgi:hypothetical protein
MSRAISIDRPRRLPIQVALRPGENPDSFVRRLAIANHLRPSYLRIYLADPPGHLGSIQIWRLAAVTGRTEEELTRVLPGLQPSTPSKPPPRRETRQIDLQAAIRRAAEQDEDVRRLSEHFGLRRPTVIKALTGQDPTTARFGHRRPQHNPVLQDVTEHLDHLIAANPDATIWSIWKKLSQERHTTASYGTVRDYVNRVRAHPTDPRSVKHLISRADLFAKIRDYAAGRDLVARLAGQFSTDHATVTRALTGQTDPDLPRKRPQSKQNPILEDFRQHIDEMITADPGVTVAAIWERLVDQHRAEVSYGTVRDYVARERRQPRPRAKPNPITIPSQSKSPSGAPSVRRPEANATPGQAR